MTSKNQQHHNPITLCRHLFLSAPITLFAFIISISSYSQPLKTYNGVFKGNIDEEGKATYTYYDDANTQERLKDGAFRYTASLKDNMLGTFTKVITGNFKKGFKHGAWLYTLTYTDFTRSVYDQGRDAANHYNATGTIVLKANFKNGLPDGPWSYTTNLRQRDKRAVFGKMQYSAYRPLDNTHINVTYRNGMYTGPITANLRGMSIVGQFDAEGNLDGKWTAATKDQEDVIQYEKGGVIRIIKRAMPQGTLMENYTEPQEAATVRKALANGTMSRDSVRHHGFELIGENVMNTDLSLVTTLLCDNYDLLHSTIGGDTSIAIDGYDNVTSYREGGYLFVLKPIQYADLHSDNDYKSAEAYRAKGQHRQAIDSYKRLVGKQLRAEDEDELRQRLRYCDSAMAVDGRRERYGYIAKGQSFYSKIRAGAVGEYRGDTMRWHYTRWVTQPDGRQFPEDAIDRVVKLRIFESLELRKRFAELQMEVFKDAAAKFDYNDSDSMLTARFGHLEGYKEVYKRFKDSVAAYSKEDEEIFLDETRRRDVGLDTTQPTSATRKAYIDCRLATIFLIRAMPTIDALRSHLKRMYAVQRAAMSGMARKWTPEQAAALSDAEGMTLCDLILSNDK